MVKVPHPQDVEARFRSPLHDERTAAILGTSLGVAFSICFLTGLLSHYVQHPPDWFTWPSRPAGLFRVTQGLHVITGIASIPLLLGKLWVVYPRFYTWPPLRSVAHAIERAGLFVLVGGSLFMLFSGVANIALWYPWNFFFPAGHFGVAWITMGGLVAHIGAKIAITRRALFTRSPVSGPIGAGTGEALLTRRGLLVTLFSAAGVLTLATAGQTFAPLKKLSLLAPRRPDNGPQGIPVNKTAIGARVVDGALSPDWRLEVVGAVATRLSLSRDDLLALPRHEARLPIACVEGWSAEATWSGVRVKDVLARAGAPDGCEVEVLSLERGRYGRSDLNRDHAADPDTLLALFLDGEPLHIDHGYPVRLIGPNRPGVLQTKWLRQLKVRSA